MHLCWNKLLRIISSNWIDFLENVLRRKLCTYFSKKENYCSFYYDDLALEQSIWINFIFRLLTKHIKRFLYLLKMLWCAITIRPNKNGPRVVMLWLHICSTKGSSINDVINFQVGKGQKWRKSWDISVPASTYSDDERRFMYKINKGHLTVFCIIFVWLKGPPSRVRIIAQHQWFVYQN